MTATFHHRARQFVKFDAYGLVFAILFLLVQVSAVLLALEAGQPSQRTVGGVSAAEPSAGAIWVGVEVIVAVAILGLAVAWQWLPEALKKSTKTAFVTALLLFGGAILSSWPQTNLLILLSTGTIFCIVLLDEVGLYWLLMNVMGLGIAVLGGAVIGRIIGIVPILIALVGFVIYDYVFADRSEFMFTMADFLLKIGLPLMIIIPDRWRFDWDDELIDRDDEGASVIGMGVGTADFALPSVFAVSVAVYSQSHLTLGSIPAPAIGIIAGVTLAVFRLRRKVESGSGAGMPALVAGSVGGYAVGIVVTAVYGGLLG